MSIKESYIKVCPTCEEGFTARRRNQIYCDPECKKMFNNDKARTERNAVNSSVHITRESMRILNSLLSKGILTASRQELERLGVEPTLPSEQMYADEEKQKIALIFYNVRLIPTDNNNFKIEHHDTIK